MEFDEYDVRVEELIAEYGWMIQGVGAGDDEPQFSYTVGLTRKGLPEVITFGLPMPTAQAILNDVARFMVAGDTIQAGSVRHDVLQNYPVEFVRVVDTTKHLTMANRLSTGSTPVDALQLVWPDAAGRFPWDEGFQYGNLIPLLGVRG